MCVFFFFPSPLFHTPSLSCVQSATHSRTNTAEQNKLDHTPLTPTPTPPSPTAKGCGVLGVCHLLRVCVCACVHMSSPGHYYFYCRPGIAERPARPLFVRLLSAWPIEFVCYLAKRAAGPQSGYE